MIKDYVKGSLNNLFHPGVPLFTAIDDSSVVDKKARVGKRCKVFHSSLGAYSYIGRGTQLIHANVGKFCSISGNVVIGMGHHTLSNLSTSPLFTEKHNGTGHSWTDNESLMPYKPVTIGNDVWVGTRAMVLGGVTIGDGAVVGAGAIVTKDIPPYAIVAGVPAKVIRYRFEADVIAKLLDIKWWKLPDELLKDNITLFQSDSIDLEKLQMVIRESEVKVSNQKD